jgi:hypothetical protein
MCLAILALTKFTMVLVCMRKHKDGAVPHYYQMLAGVMVHPFYNTVFPITVEPIQKQYGKSKNDCEHSAAK